MRFCILTVQGKGRRQKEEKLHEETSLSSKFGILPFAFLLLPLGSALYGSN
jgi:hypothetical protein